MSSNPSDPSPAETKLAEAAALLRAIDFPLGRGDFETDLAIVLTTRQEPETSFRS
jgi:hypothetical protein